MADVDPFDLLWLALLWGSFWGGEMIDVRGKIASALESRRVYQDRIDKLSDSWDALARRVDTLADVITRTGGEIAGLESRVAEGVTPDGIRGGDWNLSEPG
jgi:hypothetical protein